MAQSIHNISELERALIPQLENMVDIVAQRVYETLNYFLQLYYDSYEPSSYNRTYEYLRSAVKVKPHRKGNKVEAAVFIDYHSMDNYYNATGHQAAEWANQGLHGGLDVGNNTPHVWDDTIDNTVENGELLKLAVGYLRSKGFTVIL